MSAGQVLSHAWVERRWAGWGRGVAAGKCGGREGRRRPSEVAQRSLVAMSPRGKKAVHCRLRTCWWMEESEIMWERETRPRGQRVRGQNMAGFGGGIEKVRDANKQCYCFINQSVKEGWRVWCTRGITVKIHLDMPQGNQKVEQRNGTREAVLFSRIPDRPPQPQDLKMKSHHLSFFIPSHCKVISVHFMETAVL